MSVNGKHFVEIGTEVGKLVQVKNEAYGDAFAKSGEILRVLYPGGVKPTQYEDLLGVCRVLDKLFRIATKKDALGESPWGDVTGYGILGVARDRVIKDGERIHEASKVGTFKMKNGKQTFTITKVTVHPEPVVTLTNPTIWTRNRKKRAAKK